MGRAAYNAVAFVNAKTELLHFHNKRNDIITDAERVTLPNGSIVSPGAQGTSAEVVRWIGIWFGGKLTFQHHIKMKQASGKRAVGTLSRLANRSHSQIQKATIPCVCGCMGLRSGDLVETKKTLRRRFDVVRRVVKAKRITGCREVWTAMPNKGRNYNGTFRTKTDATFLTNERQLRAYQTATSTNFLESTGILTRPWILGVDRDEDYGQAGDEGGRVKHGEADEHASGDEA
ncbi:hypothetical protein FN846DRAFT_997437 [Sphaerosporella brunnea]|uniref:Uncharacterized protein n=1 Tax=Sphaerosporella brunnea TaxID=1250544 RepID=A0A5J5F6E2_9PEZI|nr:hypothetical protein FN846DRAFT_997437 [Sphaerosporella brunnea]